MSTLSTKPADQATSTKVRVGLGLSALLGLANIPFLFAPTPDGETGPPYIVLVLSAILGVVSIVTAVIAWRSGNRTAIRVDAACVIVNAVTTLPAFFVDVDAGIKVAAAGLVLLSVVAVVLMLGRPARVVVD
jgi:hypothetical protein